MPDHLPTDQRLHLLFDLLAWGAGFAMARFLYDWRLREVGDRIAAKLTVGYVAALVVGAIVGAGRIIPFDTYNSFYRPGAPGRDKLIEMGGSPA